MKSVTITAHDDGTYTVDEAIDTPQDGMEPSDPVLQDMDAGAFDDLTDEDVRYETLDEALDVAAALLEADPEGDAFGIDGGRTGAKPMIEGEKDFLAGFKDAAGAQGV